MGGSKMSKRTEVEILKNLQHIENELSPENLTCDGELPKKLWKGKLAILNTQRRALIRELGREPKFKELWGI